MPNLLHLSVIVVVGLVILAIWEEAVVKKQRFKGRGSGRS
jgi:hypothetical protein